jgi:hypothetical protein
VLKYYIGTKDCGISFTGSPTEDLDLRGYADAAWADDIDNRRSTGGFLFTLAGGPILWKSGRQPIVTLSSTEAEYVALTLAAKEAKFIGGLLADLQYGGPIFPVHIYEDNRPAIDISKRPFVDGRTKHIDVRYHFIRQEVDHGMISVEWVPTNQQVADGLTKALDRIKHERFVKQLNLVDCAEVIRTVSC